MSPMTLPATAHNSSGPAVARDQDLFALGRRQGLRQGVQQISLPGAEVAEHEHEPRLRCVQPVKDPARRRTVPRFVSPSGAHRLSTCRSSG
jgi:hypothetical protein